MNEYISVPYIEVKQPIGSFYLTKMTWKDLFEIAEADIRKIEDENVKNNSFDSYLGIQREVSESRVKEISKYITTFDATFPTSIILSIQSREYRSNGKQIFLNRIEELDNIVSYEEITNIEVNKEHLKIRRSKAIASILDGQHRIEGLKRAYQDNSLFEGNIHDFELNVTIFVDLDIDDQAQIFSVINKAQTKVNKSLVYDLYDYAKSRSPQKTAHDIVRILNRMEQSPFNKMIKILGKTVDKERETIAQATFVELLLGLISDNPMVDRDDIRKGKKLSNVYNENKLIFRKYFIQENDEEIIKILWNYFLAVKEVWPKSWSTIEKGNILIKTTGLIALIRLLKSLFNELKLNETTTQSEYVEILKRAKLRDKCFTLDYYIPGSSGHSQLYNDLLKCIKL